jgi:hypothetical protein
MEATEFVVQAIIIMQKEEYDNLLVELIPLAHIMKKK